jgi:SAM-dependent methyltransferase
VFSEYDRRAADYHAGRPGFPAAVVDLIAEMTGVRPPADVVDVGAGTGILTRVLAAAGHRVIGVEPNDDMRAPDARAGTAESLPLPDASVDLWTAAQAFHWFDPEPAGHEARRVLRPTGAIALVWNHLDVDDANARALRTLLVEHARPDAARGAMSRERLARFLGHDVWQRRTLTHEHALDRAGFIARVFSSDLVPARGAPGADALARAADEVFTTNERSGVMPLRYVVEVVCAAR